MMPAVKQFYCLSLNNFFWTLSNSWPLGRKNKVILEPILPPIKEHFEWENLYF